MSNVVISNTQIMFFITVRKKLNSSFIIVIVVVISRVCSHKRKLNFLKINFYILTKTKVIFNKLL